MQDSIKKHFTENRGKPDYELIVSTGLYVVNEQVTENYS